VHAVVLVLLAALAAVEHNRARLAAKSPLGAVYASLDLECGGGAIEVGDLVAPGEVLGGAAGLVGGSSLECWKSMRWAVSGHRVHST